MITRRPATTEEVLDKVTSKVTGEGRRISYRHFVMEIYNPRSQNGVSHRQHSTSKVRVIDGKPFVMRNKELVEITGTHGTLETGREFVFDLRIKSEYLN